MLKYGLKYGGFALAGAAAVGIALESYAKTENPLGDEQFDSFVLEATVTASTAYSGVGEVQDTITGNVFYFVEPGVDDRAAITDVSSGSSAQGS